MSSDQNTRTRTEGYFQDFLDLERSGNAPAAQTFVDSQPEELRAELLAMLEDYQALRGQLSSSDASLQPGRQLGDYELVREIGRGGMASVWEARQTSLERSVALKVLAPHYALSDKSLGQFQREARAGGRLAHTGIVRTFEVGEVDGLHYIAQELVPGGYTLSDRLSALREDGQLPADYYRSVARTFRKLAEALDYAHTQGILHRDIKPSNVLLTGKGEPLIADFGLAKIQGELALSRTGDLDGTPYYMSPEQAAARSMGLDHRTDIFSLGSTLYEALTLVRAFEGDTYHHVFRKILTTDPAPPGSIRSQIPRDLAVITMKLLEKNPDRRYDNMAEVAKELARFEAGEPIEARPPGLVRKAGVACKRHPVLASTTALGVVALGVISSLLVQVSRAAERAEQQTEQARGLEREALVQARQAKALQARADAQAALAIRRQKTAIDAAKRALWIGSQTSTTRISQKNSLSDLSLDLLRSLAEQGEIEEAGDLVDHAPIDANGLRRALTLPELAGIRHALESRLLEREDAEERLGAIMARSAAPAAPIPTLEGRPLLWSQTKDVTHLHWFAGEETLAVGRVPGEVDLYDPDGTRVRSFLGARLTRGLISGVLMDEGKRRHCLLGWSSHAITAYDVRGNVVWSRRTTGTILNVDLVDLDGDGVDEIVAGMNGAVGVHAFDSSGRLLWVCDEATGAFWVRGGEFDGSPCVDVFTARGVLIDNEGEIKGPGPFPVTGRDYPLVLQQGALAGSILSVGSRYLSLRSTAGDTLQDYELPEPLRASDFRSMQVNYALCDDETLLAMGRQGQVLIVNIASGSVQLFPLADGCFNVPKVVWIPESPSTPRTLVIGYGGGAPQKVSMRGFLAAYEWTDD